MTQALVGQALWQAIRYQRPRPGLIHHADRGSQYCAQDYQRLLEQHGLVASMSRRGNCYDNAPIESFWGSLKNELIYHRRYDTRAEAESEVSVSIKPLHFDNAKYKNSICTSWHRCWVYPYPMKRRCGN
jgi:putative transposase